MSKPQLRVGPLQLVENVGMKPYALYKAPRQKQNPHQSVQRVLLLRGAPNANASRWWSGNNNRPTSNSTSSSRCYSRPKPRQLQELLKEVVSQEQELQRVFLQQLKPLAPAQGDLTVAFTSGHLCHPCW